MERKKINVYVMIGLPGAGKDTWIANNLPEAHKVVCRDDIRAEIGLCNAGEKIVASPQQETSSQVYSMQSLKNMQLPVRTSQSTI